MADPVSLSGGEFTMGSTDFYPDEVPAPVRSTPFHMDPRRVTNAEFAAFVGATGCRRSRVGGSVTPVMRGRVLRCVALPPRTACPAC